MELTDNNRVAAAEMLGLSRQSLYFKLRKYGLLQQGRPQRNLIRPRPLGTVR